MISIDPSIMIVMGEMILVLVVAIGAFAYISLKSRRLNKQAVVELNERLKQNSGKRKEWFTTFLNDVCQNEGEQSIDELAAEWVEEENQFYEKLINIYLSRNSKAMCGLDEILNEHTSSYLKFVSMMQDRMEGERAEFSADTKEKLIEVTTELDVLRTEKEVLNQKLEEAYKDVDLALKEYTSAFRPASGGVGSEERAAELQTAVSPPQEPETEVTIENQVALSEEERVSPVVTEESAEESAGVSSDLDVSAHGADEAEQSSESPIEITAVDVVDGGALDEVGERSTGDVTPAELDALIVSETKIESTAAVLSIEEQLMAEEVPSRPVTDTVIQDEMVQSAEVDELLASLGDDLSVAVEAAPKKIELSETGNSSAQNRTD